jgi:putative N6-adenine-specific DNA methylase
MLFAVTAPGLAPLAAAELRGLGITLSGDSYEAGQGAEGEGGGNSAEGGVAFTGGLEEIYRANLHLRTASRVLLRLGDFYAAAFSELRKKAGRLPWEGYITPGQPVLVHATSHKSKLYHSGAVEERVLGAIGDRLGRPSPAVKGAGSPDQDGPGAYRPAQAAQMVVVRLVRDHCVISLDTSGELLHRRGYRLATAKAPLRETLAAAMLLASSWDAASPLVDPFCGSGTIPIEAALLALGIPPGRGRKFAFMHWPGYSAKRWTRLLEASPGRPLPDCPPIQAADRDAGAVRLAQANAERAGVLGCIAFATQAVSAMLPPPGPGWVVTNPPYGLRVSGGADLRNLYAQIGNVLRAHCPGWHAAILCSDARLLGQTGLGLETSFGMVNGGVSVRLGRGIIPGN